MRATAVRRMAGAAAFGGYVKGELARWTKVLKEMGINDAP